MRTEDGYYALSLNSSETTDTDGTIFHLDVLGVNFSVHASEAPYRIPVSMCPPETCDICIAMVSVENWFGRSDAVDVILQPGQ